MIIPSPRSQEWKVLIAFSADRSCRFACRYHNFDAVKERIIERQPTIMPASFSNNDTTHDGRPRCVTGATDPLPLPAGRRDEVVESGGGGYEAEGGVDVAGEAIDVSSERGRRRCAARCAFQVAQAGK